MSADPRDYPLTLPALPRDGSVDPSEGDYLGPTNAGEPGELGNPHGPSVVSPGIHGRQDVRPIRPGEVSSDAAEQDSAEKAHTAEWQPGTVPPETEEPDPEATEA
ncbi:hypothetical protein [Brachybacterium kimchii]|uniref:Multidrug transporter n=1 Tax=Brachybacterium kimchii TaxID=2942909 RepID=A0ABY4N4J3_9MICO|nr:hypothetical protein [Brachybacterium kimchii]UQN29477.1 hypothetical protein M4486_17860 [Brachybacterium kimchii]